MNREQELIGGLKNALDRGEAMDMAKQSFINAGYKPAEVEAAVQKMPQATQQIGKQVVAPAETPIAKPAVESQNNMSVAVSGKGKKLSKTFKIILIVVSVVILIAAAVLGFFWNKIF